MKRILTVFALFLTLVSASAKKGNYENFKSVAYVMVGTINQIGTYDNWEKMWNENYSKNMSLDKVYLETFRDMQFVKDDAMKAAIKFFKAKGIEVSGGITYNYSGGIRQRWETFCYTNPEQRAIVKQVAELTAGYFDEIVLDDYYFTNCKCDGCIEAKGDRSWEEFRRDLLNDAAKDLIVGPAHKVNPKCRVIVKYPNWYDHFQGCGFDLERGPYTFDGVYTGTETRDATSEQHLQAYESFGIIRYFESLRPGHNFGGWVDTGGASYPDLFAEQLWLTLLAKSPEITLFNLGSMAGEMRESNNRPWENDNTSFNLQEMKKESLKRGVEKPTWGRVAQYAYDKIDPILGKLGTPTGIKAYKPFHAIGEEFLHNYFGMIGLPIEIVSKFPEYSAETKLVVLTECASKDEQILDKMKAFMQKGGEIIVTSGFYREMQDKGIRNIFEMYATDRKADITNAIVSSYRGDERQQNTDVAVKIPVFTYITNDSWEDITTLNYENGWPLLQYSVFSKGDIFVWVIPDNFSHLYALPENALNRYRAVASVDTKVFIQGPAQVALFTYDNETFVVHNFNDTAVDINAVVHGTKGITDLSTSEVIKGTQDTSEKIYGRERFDASTCPVKVPAHSFRAFKINK